MEILTKAKAEIDERLQLTDYLKAIPEYYEMLEVAKKCIEAQERLNELLTDINTDLEPKDTCSVGLVRDMLETIKYDWVEE